MPVTIAIIDDNPELLKQLSENLSVFEEVKILFTATNGAEALKALEQCEKLPQLVLMDIEMPVIDGIEATSIIAN